MNRLGLTGTHKSHSVGYDFLLFHSVMIKREVFSDIGFLDESFQVGAGEDTDFCIRAQKAGWDILGVGEQYGYDAGQDVMSCNFPIYHPGGTTVKQVPGFKEAYKANGELLRKRYA